MTEDQIINELVEKAQDEYKEAHMNMIDRKNLALSVNWVGLLVKENINKYIAKDLEMKQVVGCKVIGNKYENPELGEEL